MCIVSRIVMMKANTVKSTNPLQVAVWYNRQRNIWGVQSTLAGESYLKLEIQPMRRKLELVKGRQPRGALVYGMRMFTADNVAAVEDARVSLADGTSGRITMHLIEGTRAQIRRQLMQSIEAFFELLDDQSAGP
jgi:hypothetical protein